jgi:hypothetical protein
VRLVSGSALVLLAVVSACGSRPPARGDARPAESATAPRAHVEDDCAPRDGRPVEPLQKEYRGLAKAARCQREVYTIMGGVTHFLGVKCEHCHRGEDYAADTHNKAVANWMARELVPRLSDKTGGEVWCNDCHVRDGRGVAKILGNPRDRGFAIEWMSTHLVERFESRAGDALFCKNCHGGTLGTPEFRAKIVLRDPPLALPSAHPAASGVKAAP